MSLLSLALLLSGVSFVLLATHAIIRDKSSYVFDYASSQLLEVRRDLETMIDGAERIKMQIDGVTPEVRSQRIEAFEQLTPFQISRIDMPTRTEPHSGLELFPIKEAESIGALIHLKSGRSYRLIDPRIKLSKTRLSKDFTLCVSTAAGEPIYSIERAEFRKSSSCQKAVQNFDARFSEGTREVSLGDTSYLVSYLKIMNDSVLVTGFISKDIAFQSAKSLWQQSVLMGLTFVFFALAISLSILRTITRRVDILAHASNELAKGNFETPISKDKNRDEISSLSEAFESMRIKIRELLDETTAKGRMEKELEAAEWVQKQFLPAPEYQTPQLSIQSSSFSASECGGDLWQFRVISNRLYFLFGDITGHGMPAALLTAAVYGSSNTLLEQMSLNENLNNSAETELLNLAKAINSTIHTSVKGATWLTCMIGTIDLQSKQGVIHNYGHPPIFKWNSKQKSITPLMSAPSRPLGNQTLEAPAVITFDLHTDDRLILVSDGLFEHRPTDGERLKKKDILKELEISLHSKHGGQQIVQEIREKAVEFFGNQQPDDITLVVIQPL